MKAMILAAGLGTRLRPLTDDRPKALVELGGVPLLEITIARLREFGVNEIIVNVHHFADKVVQFLQAKRNFGIRIEISREDELLLDTGGGLKRAAWFFEETESDEPFLLHNVDVISDIDLKEMVKAHKEKGGLATLAVQHRDSSRRLLFDENLLLCGRRVGRDVRPEIVRGTERVEELAFSGIHVVSPRTIKLMSEEGVFSIIDTYLRLAREGESIAAFRAEQYYWRDLGKPEHIQQGEEDRKLGRI